MRVVSTSEGAILRAVHVLTLVLGFVHTAVGQTTQPAPLDSDRLERKLLQQRVERQQQEIATLKAQVASLTQQLASLGMQPVTRPATHAVEAQRENARPIRDEKGDSPLFAYAAKRDG